MNHSRTLAHGPKGYQPSGGGHLATGELGSLIGRKDCGGSVRPAVPGKHDPLDAGGDLGHRQLHTDDPGRATEDFVGIYSKPPGGQARHLHRVVKTLRPGGGVGDSRIGNDRARPAAAYHRPVVAHARGREAILGKHPGNRARRVGGDDRQVRAPDGLMPQQ